jgi:hypothetical protein
MRLSLVSALAASALLLASPALAEDKKDAGYNPLGPVRLGVLAGAGAPSAVSGQLVFKYKEVIGANLELGMLPDLTINPVTVSQKMWDASVRVYPFKGAFFLGCGIGQQWLDANGSVTQDGITGTAGMEVKTTFIMPRLGLMHRFSFGLAIGADIGVEIPIAGDTSTTQSVSSNYPVPPGFNLTPPKDAQDIADKIKTTPIPVLHVLQLGYIF